MTAAVEPSGRIIGTGDAFVQLCWHIIGGFAQRFLSHTVCMHNNLPTTLLRMQQTMMEGYRALVYGGP